MPVSWSSLYLPCADAARVAQTLQESLTALGYELFNPFTQLFTKAYTRSARLFVAPSTEGWVRIIGEVDAPIIPPLTEIAPCLYAALDGASAHIAVYAQGSAADLSALQPYLRAGRTVEALRQALEAAGVRSSAGGSGGGLGAIPLPDDIQALAGKVDMKQAQSMFTRLAGNLMGKTGGDADAAQKLIAVSAPADWNSPGGQQIQAVLACLTVPDNWRTPDFTTLRDAYQIHSRLKRSPKADLYPGDAEARAAVPNALDFTPVYGGSQK